MQFTIRQIAIATAVLAIATWLAMIPERGVPLCVTYLMLAAAFASSRFQPNNECPKILFFRWHVIPLIIATVGSWFGLVFFKLGVWVVPFNWVIVLAWGLTVYCLQIVKMIFRSRPNVGVRLAQVMCSWAIVILNTLALSFGKYIGP